ncbi:MAG TPA: STAS domain-containing protein [Clostridiales bacterium]|nr:STAS domain-containing protein [Clostridiales bacterium]
MDLSNNYNEDSNTWVVKLSGEVDIYNSSQLKNQIDKLIDQRSGNITLDCTNLTYIDSTGLGVLIGILKRVKEYGGKINIRNLKPYIKKIFVITELDKVFSIEV